MRRVTLTKMESAAVRLRDEDRRRTLRTAIVLLALGNRIAMFSNAISDPLRLVKGSIVLWNQGSFRPGRATRLSVE